jgi:hypothetical protein
MHASMYVYMHICTYRVYVCMYMYVYRYVRIIMYVCTQVLRIYYVRMHVCMHMITSAPTFIKRRWYNVYY